MRFRRPGGKAAKLTLGPVDLSGKEIRGRAGNRSAAHAGLGPAPRHRGAAPACHGQGRGRCPTPRAPGAGGARRRHVLQAAIDFIKQHAMRKVRRWREQASLLGLRPDDLTPIPKGLADRWRDRPVGEIDGDDIHGIVEEAQEQGVPGLTRFAKGASESRGRALFSTLSILFSWLGERRRVRTNPCIGVARPKPPPARDRVLTADEIVKFWQAASAERVAFTGVLKLLLITGCRLREVTDMRRAELSDDGATWTIPGDRTKNHRVHVMSLPPLARSILAEAGGNGDLVFATSNGTPISVWSRIKRRLDAAMHAPPWRLHDLRRTAATGMAEIGIAPHIVEAVLNHISGARAGVAGTYNRAAYSDEKKAALERWAAHVEGLVTGRAADVVPMKAQAS